MENKRLILLSFLSQLEQKRNTMLKKITLFLFGIVCSLLCFSQANTKLQPGKTISLQSIPAAPEIALWQGGERSQISQWDKLPTVSNISEPTLTIYLPEASKANGTALIIAPGGGFHFLSIDNEGNHVAAWCVENGIAAFVLKYRLVPTGENPAQEFSEKLQKSQEEMDRTMAPYIALAKADGLAAVEHVRKHAEKYKVTPNQIGIMGFSAGGTVAAAAAYEYTSAENRPDFSAPIYPALHVVNTEEMPKKPMPLFIAVTSDDFFGFQTQTIDLYKQWNGAKQPIELHIYNEGQHGFGMKKQNLPSDRWIDAFGAWLDSYGWLKND